MVAVGELLPALDLTDSQGTRVVSADLVGHWSAFFFYPKDDTPG